MKFPILIHMLNKKVNHIVKDVHELPIDQYFKIIRTKFVVNDLTLDCDYRVVTPEPTNEIDVSNEPPQEDNEPPVADSESR